ncbi:MAG: type II toxin-antitoxin system PemK/MazF family toxin [Deltaproteobacteria bacterium]|nr:type II toxin-antitoxin system PemK/MazF family toxin [Deltaproteobacteria bacterium]
MKRGEIWWATLPDPIGSGPGFRRPVLVVQKDAFNRSALSTVLVVVITGNLRLSEAPGNVMLPKKYTGLPHDSVANISQIITIDKCFLTDFAGALSRSLYEKVEAGLRLILL